MTTVQFRELCSCRMKDAGGLKVSILCRRNFLFEVSLKCCYVPKENLEVFVKFLCTSKSQRKFFGIVDCTISLAREGALCGAAGELCKGPMKNIIFIIFNTKNLLLLDLDTS